MQDRGAEQECEIGGGIRARQREERGHLIAVVAGGMALTEVQVGSSEDVDERIQTTHDP